MTVGSSQATRPSLTSRDVPRMSCTRSRAPGRLPSIIMLMRSGIAGLAKAASLASGWSAGSARHVASFSAIAWGDRVAVFRCPDGAGIDAGTAAVGADRLHHDVEVLLPIVRGVIAEDDLGKARPVKLNAGGRGRTSWSCWHRQRASSDRRCGGARPAPPWSVG